MRVLPSGPRAVLIELDSIDQVMAATAAVRSLALPGVVDVVPAARTVLVCHTGIDLAPVIDAVASAPVVSSDDGPLVTIAVRYDGADLADVAAACDLSVAEVVALHGSIELRVAFCGFLPGFAYLVGLPSELHLPRLATPRSRVPAGAVAIAGEFASVYPSASPGGWHLLGTTDAVMWDDRRDPPALLEPGTRVRFVRA
jgi:KipI family sensor histidine kinase inhibitor